MAVERRSVLALVGFLAASAVVAGVGGWFTSLGMPAFYGGLEKPSWNPPSWLFGPVWTTLYVLMAVAAWLVWREVRSLAAPAVVLYGAQLLLNLFWSGIFFALQSPGWALVELVALWIAILATTALFFRHSKLAGSLLVPYLAWVTFAGALNAAIVGLN